VINWSNIYSECKHLKISMSFFNNSLRILNHFAINTIGIYKDLKVLTMRIYNICHAYVINNRTYATSTQLRVNFLQQYEEILTVYNRQYLLPIKSALSFPVYKTQNILFILSKNYDFINNQSMLIDVKLGKMYKYSILRYKIY